ncbi:transketolase C-terminal domain-containing protein [Chloroflexota bacterium]
MGGITSKQLIRAGLLKLLDIKDSDIRIMNIEQARDATDKKIHCGGAFSAIIPLVALFYGGVIKLDLQHPTKRGNDMFVLSEGHTVATMASIYADLGYFNRSVLKNSRSVESILNGHPGPLLPGVHAATGPLGQGLGVAEGLALIGQEEPGFDVFCLNGDGELQEGPIWEAITYSGYKRLDNLCILINYNCGQHDDTKSLVCPLPNLGSRLDAFGWRVFDVDATNYEQVLSALQAFKLKTRDGRPTAIICWTEKGYGAFSNLFCSHNLVVSDDLAEEELKLQRNRRSQRVSDFLEFFNGINGKVKASVTQNQLLRMARDMNLAINLLGSKANGVTPIQVPVKKTKAPKRKKKIVYDSTLLPQLDKAQKYGATDIITKTMSIFAKDHKVVSIDADLAKLSGLQAGVVEVDPTRALNVGIAEANMMCIGEGYALMGYNVWVSTLGLFFDWKVMRRIAIGYQERLETMSLNGGWLSEGHGLDITFVATGPNIELTTGGATHLGNDDSLLFAQIAHLKIIDTCCPNQLIAVMKWIMEGNKGLVYLRIMRTPSAVIYGSNLEFEFGKGFNLKESADDRVVIVSSGRGVYEAITASEELARSGIKAGVIDMPSIDETMILGLYHSNKLIVIVEQNNGYIYSEFVKVLFKSGKSIDTSRLLAINTADKEGRPQFIHSGTYQQLVTKYGLMPYQIVETIKAKISS